MKRIGVIFYSVISSGMEENKKSASPKQQLRLWGIKSDSVANGMGQVGACLPYDAVVFFAAGVFFFRRSRLFFREATFFSGGEGCEWRALRHRGREREKAEKHIFGFLPLDVPRKGFSPHIPDSRLFVLFHTTNPTIPPRKKQHSLLVLPSVHTIINFATKFFDILTKKQFEHPQRVFQVFQVFRVFQVFHFAFGPQNSPVLVQIRTKQVFQVFQAGSP